MFKSVIVLASLSACLILVNGAKINIGSKTKIAVAENTDIELTEDPTPETEPRATGSATFECGEKQCLFLPTQVDAQDASRICKSNGAQRLSTPDNKKMDVDLITIAASKSSAGAWTAGSVKNGVLSWVTVAEEAVPATSTTEQQGYTNWGPGQPRGDGCVAIRPNAFTGYKWAIADCNTQMDVICSF